jgi:hypothetical protein
MSTDPVEILRQRNAEVEQIRGFVDLTEEAKNRRIAEVNERVRAEYAEALEANERESAERLERFKKAVFRVPVSHLADEGEKAQIFAAYRSALNDVHFATTFAAEDPAEATQELMRLLQQAERSGDELLARAVYHRGIDLGVQEIVNNYLATRPTEEKNWTAYTEAHQEVNQSKDVGHLFERSLTERALSSEQESGLTG